VRADHLDIERRALDQIEPKLISRGYRLIREPLPDQLPDFVGRYVPDAIAVGAGPSIAVEIKGREGPDTERSLVNIRQMFEGRKDWAFEAYYFSSLEPEVAELSMEVLAEREHEISEIAKIHPQAAFVLSWSVLEASVRSCGLLENVRGGIGPNRIISLLASEGYISGNEMQSLLELVKLRNQIVHGQLNEISSEDNVRQVLEIARLVRNSGDDR